MIFQNLYVPIFNYFYKKIILKIGSKQKNIIIIMCFSLIFIVQFLSIYILQNVITPDIRDYIICILLGVIIVMSINNKLIKIKWNKWFYSCFVIIAMLILVAGIDHYLGVTYGHIPFIMLFGFMPLYFVWGNRCDYEVLFELIAKAYLIFSFIILFISLIKFPYIHSQSVDAGGYSILGMNSNGFAKLIVPTIACSIYLALMKHKEKISFLYLGVLGAVICLTYLSQARFGILVVAIILLLGACLYLKVLIAEKNDWKKVCIKLIISSVIMCAFIFVTFLWLQKITPIIAQNAYFITYAQEEIKQEIEIDEEISKKFDPGTLEYGLEVGKKCIGDNDFLNKLNTISSQRVYIWAAYLHNMSWRGVDSNVLGWDPHNQYVELSFKTGVLTGLLWLIFNISVLAVITIRIKKEYKTYSFILFVFIGFFAISLIECGLIPFERGYNLIYYLSISPLFIRNKVSVKS